MRGTMNQDSRQKNKEEKRRRAIAALLPSLHYLFEQCAKEIDKYNRRLAKLKQDKLSGNLSEELYLQKRQKLTFRLEGVKKSFEFLNQDRAHDQLIKLYVLVSQLVDIGVHLSEEETEIFENALLYLKSQSKYQESFVQQLLKAECELKEKNTQKSERVA
jgi:hypothetical protein